MVSKEKEKGAKKERENLTMIQIRERKIQLEKTIHTMLQEFQDSTGLNINGVDVGTFSTLDMSTGILHVKLDINL